MKKFCFSLQSVHDLRLNRREQAERALADKDREVQEAAARLADLENKRATAMRAYAELMRMTDAPDAQEIALRADYIALLERRENDARQRLAQLERERDGLRQKVIEAAREAETTEKLREHQYAQYVRETLRLEQKLLDELAMLRVARRMTQ